MPTDPSTLSDEDFVKFCQLMTEEGKMPAGKITYVTGKTVFVDGNGNQLAAKDYKAKYGFDPAPVWEKIKAWRAENLPDEPEQPFVIGRPGKTRTGAGRVPASLQNIGLGR